MGWQHESLRQGQNRERDRFEVIDDGMEALAVELIFTK
jgi:hypothetical protein